MEPGGREGGREWMVVLFFHLGKVLSLQAHQQRLSFASENNFITLIVIVFISGITPYPLTIFITDYW